MPEKKAKRDKNTVILEGNLCKDPRYHFFPDGNCKLSCRLAVNNNYIDTQGNEVKNPLFITVVRSIKKDSGEEKQYEGILVKGAPIRVEGCLNQRSYTDASGEHTIIEVVAFKIEKRVFEKKPDSAAA